MRSPQGVDDLVAIYLERRESGDRVSPIAFAREYPQWQHELRTTLEKMEETEALFPDSTMTPHRLMPRQLGPYQITREIGRGGMGQVLEAIDVDHPDRSLAVKLLNPACLLNPRALTRFRREARVLEQLEIPGVVRVYDSGLVDGSPFIALEHIDGPDLAQLVRQAKDGAVDLPGQGSVYRRIAALVLHLAETLEELHGAGIIHRDLKPANVILRDGAPVLVDFGLVAHAETMSLTATGDLLGSVPYMAPEQARGESADERTDVYGLGAILYELLTLQPPHRGDDAVQLIRRVGESSITPSRRRVPDIPEALDRIACRALAFRASRRYASAADLAEDLRAFIDDRSITASRAGLVEQVGNLWTRKRRELSFVAVVLGVVVALSVGLVNQVRRDGDSGFAIRSALDQGTLAWVEQDRAAMTTAVSELKELDPAHPMLAVLNALFLSNLPKGGSHPAIAALVEGMRLQRSGDGTAAADAYERALDLQPDWSLATVKLADVFEQGEDWEHAARELIAAVRRLPDNARLFDRLARVHLKRHALAEAAVAMERAEGLDATDSDRPLFLAQVYYDLKEPAKGIAAARRALALHEEPNIDALKSLATNLDGADSHQEAEEIFEEILRHRNDSGDHYALAYCYDLQCKIREAREQYLATLSLSPQRIEPLTALAHLSLGANRETCEKCAEHFDAHPEDLDPAAARRYILRILDLNRGSHRGLTLGLVDFARRAGCEADLKGRIEILIDKVESDSQIANLQRSLRRLKR